VVALALNIVISWDIR